MQCRISLATPAACHVRSRARRRWRTRLSSRRFAAPATPAQAFLAALSATANIRLSSAAAGASPAAFYRRRQRNPGFAREYQLALETAHARIGEELVASALPDSFEDDHWSHNALPPVPPMTISQALQLLYLHQKEAILGQPPRSLRRRPGESREEQRERLILLSEARGERAREKYRIAEAARRAGNPDAPPPPHAPPPPPLPDLAQVTGWSRADPAKQPHDPTRALFGGWRLGNL